MFKNYTKIINGIEYYVVESDVGDIQYKQYAQNAVKTIRYYLSNKLHNESGAAVIKYDQNNNILFKRYYLNGCYLDNIKTDEELQQYLKFKNF